MSDTSNLIKLTTNSDIVTHLRGVATAHKSELALAINAGIPDLSRADKSGRMPQVIAPIALYVYSGNNHEVSVDGANGFAMSQLVTNRISVMSVVKNSDANSSGASADLIGFALRQFLTAAMMMYSSSEKDGSIFRYIGDTLYDSNNGVVVRIYHFEQLITVDYSSIYYADGAFDVLKAVYGNIIHDNIDTPYQQEKLDE